MSSNVHTYAYLMEKYYNISIKIEIIMISGHGVK